MLAGIGKAGDYAGDPLLTVGENGIYWLDTGKTKIRAYWAAAFGVNSNAHWILYNHGVIANRITAQTYDFTVAQPGIIPNLAAVAVPANCDDGVYDPLSADPSAVNLFSRNGRVIERASVAQRVGNRSSLQVGFAAALASGNRSSLGVGVKVGA